MYTILGPDNQTKHGPGDLEQVRQWIAAGLANEQTLVYQESENDRVPLDTIPELAALLKPVAAPIPIDRPDTPKVFGIMNIIFGAMMILFSPVVLSGVLAAVAGISFVETLFKFFGSIFGVQLSMFSALKTLGIVFAVVFVVASILYLISGIGLMKYCGWARKLALGNAALIIVFAIFYTIYRSTKLADSMGSLGFVEIVLLGKLIFYPGIQLGLLTRPAVRDSCP